MFNDKWRTHITHELCKKHSCRSGELKKEVPRITNTMLSSALRYLEELGIVHLEQFNNVLPQIEYFLMEQVECVVSTVNNDQCLEN